MYIKRSNYLYGMKFDLNSFYNFVYCVLLGFGSNLSSFSLHENVSIDPPGYENIAPPCMNPNFYLI